MCELNSHQDKKNMHYVTDSNSFGEGCISE